MPKASERDTIRSDSAEIDLTGGIVQSIKYGGRLLPLTDEQRVTLSVYFAEQNNHEVAARNLDALIEQTIRRIDRETKGER